MNANDTIKLDGSTSQPADDRTVTAWDEDRDTRFFTIVARLFSAEFAYGAGVLLSTYDAE